MHGERPVFGPPPHLDGLPGLDAGQTCVQHDRKRRIRVDAAPAARAALRVVDGNAIQEQRHAVAVVNVMSLAGTLPVTSVKVSLVVVVSTVSLISVELAGTIRLMTSVRSRMVDVPPLVRHRTSIA